MIKALVCAIGLHNLTITNKSRVKKEGRNIYTQTLMPCLWCDHAKWVTTSTDFDISDEEAARYE